MQDSQAGHPYAAHRRASSPGDGERGNNDRAQFNSLRRLLHDIAENREPGDVTTLRDASVLTQLQQNAAAGKYWQGPSRPAQPPDERQIREDT